uniref:Secreted protein n=1 Tax=Ascaris lumbricoides TaxID=6252 RepID=A0A0M3HIK0_ASCLU
MTVRSIVSYCILFTAMEGSHAEFPHIPNCFLCVFAIFLWSVVHYIPVITVVPLPSNKVFRYSAHQFYFSFSGAILPLRFLCAFCLIELHCGGE